MRMQVILDSLFTRLGSNRYDRAWKREFRDWTNLYHKEGQFLALIAYFSSKWHMKMLTKTGPKGEPIATTGH